MPSKKSVGVLFVGKYFLKNALNMIKMGNDIDVDPRGVFRPYLRQQAAAEGAQNKTGA